ncbi:A/G-specific adenine glycosylase [Endozoicomonas atrinae]|uniref:A/G-specific adenine glycosylase n=1 Tax=Endozoicomonas atrinae TaxID=1333660 RepID=UPI00082703A4|nr:A/G-specific adenine glycosylase [Endozoicomonas atrinae]
MTQKDAYTDSTFSQRLLDWFDAHGRKHLPWQQNKTPYRVWISEIMLQQTQVTTVIPYYQKFMERFPAVTDLAAASEDEVLHFWSGLGYYSRARNLHNAAKKVVSEFSGTFPCSVEQLMALPGIGRSTAGAIASISMGIRAPIMDGNVKRVLTRHFAIHGWPGQTRVANELWDIAEKLTPESRTGDYTQVMMDLGATVCKRSKPTCQACPLEDSCIAHKLGQERLFPESKPKKDKPEKSTIMLMVVNQYGEILLEKRPPSGIWGGLWSFPEISNPDQIIEQALEKTGLLLKEFDTWQSFRHTFSHYHLDITPALSFVEYPGQTSNTVIKDHDSYYWFALHQSPELGLAAPVKKLLQKVEKTL